MRIMNKGKGHSARIISVILCFVLLLAPAVRAEEWSDEWSEDYQEDWSDDWSEEEDTSDEEGEFIPEAYYDPIDSNAVPGWPQGPAVQAGAAVVMDLDTGTLLYSKNALVQHYPASITKVMTALVALDEKGDKLDENITCTHAVYEIESGSSNLWMEPGEIITLRQALYGLMLESANDLGMAIAVYVAGSVEGFADLMNAKAASLGCENTHFTNPHGLHDENHYTCASDMAKIAAAAYANPVFREICGTVYYGIPKTNMEEEPRYLLNHHRILRDDEEYYRTWCTGGKTGYTSDAWNTLVTYGEQNDRRLVCVVLRENGLERSYNETIELMEYGFANFTHANMTGDISSPSFYQVMGLDIPDIYGTIERAKELEEPVLQVESQGIVTIPVNMDKSALEAQTQDGEVLYTLGGWPVGSSRIVLSPLPQKATYTYKQKRDMETLLRTSENERKKKEVFEAVENTWDQVMTTMTGWYDTAENYVKNNKMTVFLIGMLVLAVLIVLIVILILRSTRESRIRRRRLIEQKRRQRAEEEIERMSALEIEEELREAMEAEREKAENADEKPETEIID